MFSVLEHSLQDVNYAVRALRKSPGFTLTVLGALALGVGATSAIFTVVNSVLLKPLPFPNPDRLVALREINPLGNINPSAQTQNILDWRARNRSFAYIAALQSLPSTFLVWARPNRSVAYEFPPTSSRCSACSR